MDIAMLVIGFFGLVAAALAAWFAYPGWKAFRRRPDLRLILEPGRATSAQFFVKLRNDGNGSADHWMAMIQSPTNHRIMPADFKFEGWSDRQTESGWEATWLSYGADDSIGPHLHREMLAVNGGVPFDFEGRYTIRAQGMKGRSGWFRVTIDDQRNQSMEVI